MTRNITCTACPLGCAITVELNEDGAILSVSGNTCKRGDAYARTEVLAPTRTLTTTVRLTGGSRPVLPVKSASPLPKQMLFDCMKVLNHITVSAPVKIGDVIVPNILDSGIDIVASEHME